MKKEGAHAIFIVSRPAAVSALGANPLPGDPYIIVNKATNALAVVKDNRIEGIYQVATENG